MLYDWSMESNYITDKWRRISQSEIRNSAAAESEGGQKFLPPNPLPFCPPERSVSTARSAAISRNFVQNRFELRSAIATKKEMENQTNISDQNIQQVGQKLTSQSVQLPEKQKINFWAISTISLFLILVVLGGLYLYRLNFASLQNKKSVNTSVTKNEDLRPDISNTKDGWKTYNNSKFYYSFSYPSDYSLAESKNLPENILHQVFVESGDSNPSSRKNFIISVKKAVNLEEEIKYQRQTIEGHVLASLKKESRTAKDGLAGVQLDYEPMAETKGLQPFTIVILG